LLSGEDVGNVSYWGRKERGGKSCFPGNLKKHESKGGGQYGYDK